MTCRRRRLFGLIDLCLFGIVTAALAANGGRSLQDETVGYTSLTLTKALSVDRWEGEIHWREAFPSLGSFDLDQRVKVVLHRSPGFRNRWKYDEQLMLNFERKVGKHLMGRFSGEWERFLDERSRRFDAGVRPAYLQPAREDYTNSRRLAKYMAANELENWYFGFGASYEWIDEYAIDGSIGAVLDDRSQVRQRGAGLRLKVNDDLPNRWLSGDLWLDRLASGDDYGWSMVMRSEKELAAGATDRFRISASGSGLRESPTAGGGFDRRNDQLLHLTNRLRTRQNLPWNLQWNSELIRERSDHTGGSEAYSDLEFVWRNEMDLTWRISQWHSGVSGGIDVQEQQYAGSLNQGRRGLMGLRITFLPAGSDSIALSTKAMRYRFDTPSKADNNDRDELRYRAALHAGWSVSPHWGLRGTVETDLKHLVYLYRPRSSENRWERLFRLAVEVPWNHPPVSNSAYFAVSGTYTVYDFQPARESRSRVYRAFTASDSLNVQVLSGLSVVIHLNGIVDDHGILRWDDWVEDVSEEGFGYSMVLSPRWSVGDYSVGAGWMWNARETRLQQTDGTSLPGESVYSDGPVLAVATPTEHSLQAELTGSILSVRDSNRGRYNLPDIWCKIKWIY